jgi:hypothetical protein
VDKESGIQIFGMKDHPIERLRLENIRIVFKGGGTTNAAAQIPRELGTGYPEPRGTMPAYGLFARHVKGLELANITFSFDKEDLRPALACEDLDDVEIDNFKAQVAEGVAPARWQYVTGLTVRNSPVLAAVETK